MNSEARISPPSRGREDKKDITWGILLLRPLDGGHLVALHFSAWAGDA